MSPTKHNPRYHAVASRLPRLPRELVHQVFNDLWIQKILEILCNHNSTYLDDCTSSHFKIGKFLPSTELPNVKDSSSLYLRICALHRGNPHPHIDILENSAAFFLDRIKQNRPVDIDWEIRNAIVSELDEYTHFIPVLNSVVPDHILPWGSPAFRDVSRAGLKQAFDLIDAAEVTLNTIKANQLRRMADVLEKYPNYVRTCCEKDGEGSGRATRQRHRVEYLRSQADKMPLRQILDGRFVARSIFAQDQFYLVPYNRVLRVFLKVLHRIPPANIHIPEPYNKRCKDAVMAATEPGQPLVTYKAGATHYYPARLELVLDGVARYNPVGDSPRAPPPRVLHTAYSLLEHKGRGGAAQPSFFLYNFQPRPRYMKKWEGLWPMPEKEFEWLEGFLSICDYMSGMREEWSPGRTVAEYWKLHVGDPR